MSRLDKLGSALTRANSNALSQKTQDQSARNRFKKAAEQRGSLLLRDFKKSQTFDFLKSLEKLRLRDFYNRPIKLNVLDVNNPKDINGSYQLRLGTDNTLHLRFPATMRFERPDLAGAVICYGAHPIFLVLKSQRQSRFLPSWHFSRFLSTDEKVNSFKPYLFESAHTESRFLEKIEKRMTDTCYSWSSLLHDAIIRDNKDNRGENVVDFRP